ncbi:hypothetical protein GOC15_22665 [Sinorhizobium meliloti]|nr:hypothetical protein [Sinorhizobium meliloti]
MGWKYADIAIERGAKAGERFKDASREELLQRIVDLETQLYPLYVALSPITEKSWRGTGVSSMLFPLRPEEHDDKFFVYNSETKKSDIVDIAEKDLHSAGYYTEDGLTIKDGANLHDDFEIISFHQSAPACYVGNGSVFVGDIRRLIEVFNGPYREAQP